MQILITTTTENLHQIYQSNKKHFLNSLRQFNTLTTTLTEQQLLQNIVFSVYESVCISSGGVKTSH